MPNTYFARGVRLVALFEGAKGLAVLLAGFGLLALLHHDVQKLAVQLIERMHLNPARKYPSIFIDAAKNVTDAKLWMLAGIALAYSLLRGAEAYGLWKERRWAEWLAVASGSIYLPLEFYELAQGVSWIRAGAVIVNVGIVVFMGLALRHRPRGAELALRVNAESER